MHYVPIARDLSDLIEKIFWAKENDEEARAIAAKGAEYARQRLMPANVLCYHAEMLKQWGEKSKENDFRIEDFEGMEVYEDDDPAPSHMCHCPSLAKEEL